MITDPGMPPSVFVVPDEALNQDDIKRLNRLLEYIDSVDFDAEDFRECKDLREVHDAIIEDQGLEDDEEAPEFDWYPDQKLAVTRAQVRAREAEEARRALGISGTTTGRLSSKDFHLSNLPKPGPMIPTELLKDVTIIPFEHLPPTAREDWARVMKAFQEAGNAPEMKAIERRVVAQMVMAGVISDETIRRMIYGSEYRIVGESIGRWTAKEPNIMELPKKLKTPKGTEIERAWEPCCDGCLGWLHMSDPYEVEACDECHRFKKENGFLDDQARAAHREECGCGWPDVDFQDAAMSWVRDLNEGDAVNNLTQSDISELETLLDCREVEFMDNVTPAIYVCSRLIEKTKEGPDNNRLKSLMTLLKKVQDGISNEALKLKDFGYPPGAPD